MNKTTLVAMVASTFALSLVAGVSFADTSSTSATPVAGAAKHHGNGHLIKELGLSKDQVKQIKTIRTSTKTQADAIKNDATLSETDKKAKIKDLHKASMKQIEAILTPEQKDKLKQLRQERKNDRKDKAANADQ